MRLTGHLTVDRENRRQGMKDLEAAVARSQSGESVLVFPEGTRNTRERLLDFQSGAFILVVKSGLPIVPVIIDGSREVLPKGSIFVRPRTVRIKALSPLDWAGKYTLKERDRLKRELWELMQNEYLELQQWDKQNRQ
jgi:1-acyl-sn-glycerol-3-phosphate acyltransferase